MSTQEKRDYATASVIYGAALSGKNPDQIAEGFERDGQASLATASRLPTDGNWAALEARGVKRGARLDSLFTACTLPPGWKIEAEGHAMWSKLLDDKGEEAASIFYKASPWDRVAEMYVRQ